MSSFESASITIGDLAARTGVSVATLRAWESRYGFPRPRRIASGHRRYSDADAEQIESVVRLRAAGMSLETAIARQRTNATSATAPRSIFADLRRTHPQLNAHVLSRRAMTAISTAIEDECCARATQPLLIGFFQRERFYRAREQRWRELARTAATTLVFADFDRPVAPPAGPVEIPLSATTPLRREWAVICQAPDAAACLVAWERPPLSRRAAQRRFEAVWSLAPEVTVTAARAALAHAAALVPELLSADAEPLLMPADPAAALTRATAVTNRIVAYLDS